MLALVSTSITRSTPRLPTYATSAVKRYGSCALEGDVPRMQRALVQAGRDDVERGVQERCRSTGMMPFDGMSSSAGSGEAGGHRPGALESVDRGPVVVLLHRVVEGVAIVRERNRARRRSRRARRSSR